MKFAVVILICLFVLQTYCTDSNGSSKHSTGLKILTPEESSKMILSKRNGTQFTTKLAKQTIGVPPDNGGNYGDLIYMYREDGDVLLLREVAINQEVASVEQDIQWYAVFPNARRISSVRVLNIGRERAYTIRIDVAANEVQAIIRIPRYFEARLIIEVYGF